MATHDYVIANGTGAAVRSDLNNALAAIVSNNSSSSEPGTTYAYQWWADTNANVLKIRNSSNDGWITLRELDGTMLIEDGSASTPGLAFADDVNTGIFSPAADQIGFATGGAERLEIGSSEVVFNDPSNDVDFRVESNGNTHMLFVDAGNDAVGINRSVPDNQLSIGSTASFHTDANSFYLGSNFTSTGSNFIGSSKHAQRLFFNNASGNGYLAYANTSSTGTAGNAITWEERLRIDSSGRLLVGATTTTHADANAKIQATSTGGTSLVLARDDSSIVAGNTIGMIQFYGNDGGTNQQCAEIRCDADGTQSNNNKPSRLVFGTTANDASSATEAMRIDSSQRLLVGLTSSGSGSLIEAKTGAVGGGSSVLGVKAFTANIPYATSNKTSSMLSGFDGGTIHGVDVGYSYDGSGYYFSIATNDSTSGTPDERFRIDRNGQIGILANTNPITARSTAGATTVNEYFTGLHSATAVHTTGTVAIKIYTNGNIQNTNNSYGQLSDVKLKENIVNASSQWDDIKGVQVRNFNFKEETGNPTHTQIGVVAQEVETVSPGLVYETPDRETVQVPVLDKNGEAVLDENGEAVLTAQERELGTTTKSVSYSVLYMKAVKALQEAMDRIETLETKVAALEAG